MNNKELLKYIIYLVLGVLVIDGLTRLCLTPVFRHLPPQTKAYETYKFISCTDSANMIILGASAATHHYIPKLFEDSLGVKCFNYGRDGRSILYQYLSLLKAEENGHVDIALLDFGKALVCDEWNVGRISDLYPYYWMNDTVKSMVNEVKGMEARLLMLSALIQFNSQYLNLVAPTHSEKGYVPLHYSAQPLKIDSLKEDEEVVDVCPIALKYFSRIIDYCHKNKIRLILCISPNAKLASLDGEVLDLLCKNKKVEIWNMVDFVKDLTLYNDIIHLNEKGAEVYTNEIIRRIKETR